MPLDSSVFFCDNLLHRSSKELEMAATKEIRPVASGAIEVSLLDVAIRSGIVALTLATGLLHLTLGGLLFTLNGLGYLTAAVAMVIPLELAIRYRGVVRLGLMA